MKFNYIHCEQNFLKVQDMIKYFHDVDMNQTSLLKLPSASQVSDLACGGIPWSRDEPLADRPSPEHENQALGQILTFCRLLQFHHKCMPTITQICKWLRICSNKCIT